MMEVLGVHTGYSKLSAQRLPHREYNRIAGTSPVNVGQWERIASALLGGFLVYRAVKNRNWSALLFGGTGMGLLNRGLSGYCPMYNKTGLSSTNS
jgi:hypothetical protein